jgi:serine/threonine protein kinase
MSSFSAAASNSSLLSITFRSAREALEALHSLGVAHCDVRGSNVLLRPDGSVVLIDFGHARLDAGPEEMSQDSLNMEGLLSSALVNDESHRQLLHECSSDPDAFFHAGRGMASGAQHHFDDPSEQQLRRPVIHHLSAFGRGHQVAPEGKGKVRFRGPRPVKATLRGGNNFMSQFRPV